MNRSWQLSRRTLLRGAGATVALPWLQAMAAKPNAAAPVRMAILYTPNGVNPHHWSPKETGADYKLTEILQPLAAHRTEFNVLGGLHNPNSRGGDGHYVKTAGFLTSETISKTTGRDLNSGGISMDQLAAQRLANVTRFPSIELGIDPIASGVDRNVGYTQLYGSHLSWKSPTTPLPCQLNPVYAFNRLFRPELARTNVTLDEQSRILDVVHQDAKAMLARLGAEDRHKVEQYLAAVDDVESRVRREAALQSRELKLDPYAREQIKELSMRIDGFAAKHPDAQAFQVTRSGDHTSYVRLMLDIMVLALWTDSTRVASFMFGRSVSGKNFSFLDGVDGGFHQLSHHENNGHKMAMYKRINIWHTQQFAYFLDRMRGIKEGDRTLLDNSVVLYGSSLRDGNKHEWVNLPLILAGRGGGKLKTGQHLKFEKDNRLSNLYLTMLDCLGTPVPKFADSTAPLSLS